MHDSSAVGNVLVTGGTGFVGSRVVRRLLSKGLTPVCLVRSPAKLFAQQHDVSPDRLVPVVGDLGDRAALKDAAGRCRAAIHLVGIILARRLRGQTFHRVHVCGTQNVVDAVRAAGIRRYVHMSALGSRPDAVSTYHRTKWAAEQYVRESGLDWTIFRPSLIHGPDGEFMQLMKRFVCGLMPPVMPYFGSGTAKVQPVSVEDVAFCVVETLHRDATVCKEIPMGGPRVYTWLEMYRLCRDLVPRARRWKPVVSLPVPVAKLAAVLSAAPMAVAEWVVPSLGMLRFDSGQVRMSQEDSVCDPAVAEQMFGIRLRGFEDELAAYADQIA